jgi:lipopolysaccharide/colanic/teichoic acid biosynthesis glycosyltransferase
MGIGPFYEMVLRKVPLFQVGQSWLVHTSFQRATPDVLLVKRAFDIVFSLMLLILLFPFGLLVALAIKLESPGPALFIQERSGRGGRVFRFYKFRSMHLHPDDSLRWPHWEPDLVTRVGHFIRKTGIDECPQLFNILKGDMSFVGPRPARPLVTQRHINTIPFYAISLALRPGVTGWAQLRQGQDIGDQSLLERVRYNLYYARNYSLLLDLEIIFKTFRAALLGKKPQQFQVPVETPSSTISGEKSGGAL